MEPTENNSSQNTNTTQATVPTPTPGTGTEHANGSDNRTLMGILCYLSILVLIPLLVEKKDPFVKFHVSQGLALLIIQGIIFLVAQTFLIIFLFPIVGILNLVLLVFSILGIVYVVQGKEVALPVIGGLARKLNL